MNTKTNATTIPRPVCRLIHCHVKAYATYP